MLETGRDRTHAHTCIHKHTKNYLPSAGGLLKWLQALGLVPKSGGQNYIWSLPHVWPEPKVLSHLPLLSQMY